jgi:hypothetical protein
MGPLLASGTSNWNTKVGSIAGVSRAHSGVTACCVTSHVL